MSEAANNWGFDPDANPLKGATKCPHCGGVSRTEIDQEMRYVCGTCGAPRVRLAAEVRLSGAELEHLQHAERLRKKRGLLRGTGAASGVAGVMALIGALFATLFLGVSLGMVIATLAVVAPFAVLAMWTLARAGTLTTELKQAVDRAWKSAVRDVAVAAGGPITAAQLKKTLPLALADSEALLAQLTVDDSLSSRISAGGELVFEATAGGPRIAVEELGDPLEARFKVLEAEQQAAAEEEAATAEQQARQRRGK